MSVSGGFPVVQIPEMEEEEREHVRSMGREYLRRKLEDLTVGITAYSYAMEEEGLTPGGDGGGAGGRRIGSEAWGPCMAAPGFSEAGPGGRGGDSRFLRRGDHEKRMELPVQLPKISGPCRIGVCLEEGLRAPVSAGRRGQLYKIRAVFTDGLSIEEKKREETGRWDF